MQCKSISGMACAVGIGALAIGALTRGGPLNPPPGPVASTGATLEEINLGVGQLLGGAAAGPSAALSTIPVEYMGVIQFTPPAGAAPITGDEIIGPFADAIGVHGVSGPNRSRGETTLGDIVVVKELDKATPKLQEAICNGAAFPEVTIDLLRSDAAGQREPYLRYKLKNVIVTSYSMSTGNDAGGEAVPTESLSFNYTEVEWTYIPSSETHTSNKDGSCAAPGA